MREWFQELAPREQLMVSIAGVVAAAMLFFLLVWEPLLEESSRLDTDILDARELVLFMQQASAEAKSLGGGARRAPQANRRSLLSEVDSSSKRSGMESSITRIQPEEQTRVRLWIEDARFDTLMAWLHQLQNRQGIVLENGSLDRDDKAGTVKARLTLMRAGT